ncbi:MAG: bifunctional phosphopantothenoylcysteine decarboxylase/phosphopantothenate--cysteine ligase CoaBC [Pseudomonadota bacterium]|nr:bifunctional phosphopantothenoylcysteine decarboxylase/phosphopantothenate--cysteine ligase CoaBC [Pseudomonadota bacterium]
MTHEKKILLIVTGGVAAYKSLELLRLLIDEKISVLPVMTSAATKFVAPLSFSVLCKERVFTDLWNEGSNGVIDHIELSRKVDLIVVAPATANFIAKAANGIADDLATNLLLATNKKVLLAPSMNVQMWEHKATKRNVNTLISDGVEIIGPQKGAMACGDFGMGRMTEPRDIFAAARKALNQPRRKPLRGRRVLVTSGPTLEPIDPVRFISNRSSGKQGKAIADALLSAGAEVVFVTGPVASEMPRGATIRNVETGQEMLDTVLSDLSFDVAIFAAAVSDWKPKSKHINKIKKNQTENSLNLAFSKNPDILATVGRHINRPKIVIGFAAETENLLGNAQKKLIDKGCDLIIVNDVNVDTGVMGGDKTTVQIMSKTDVKSFPQMSKADFSELLVDRIVLELK